ncbi:MAG: FAD-dependent oxidoreductase, partial [Saprospiraceae bacterium]|nr:FAD-dependent oxidoreductase [Saprospiraceae bacterium]
MNKTDVLIIGSGVAGMSSAIQLALLNKDIQITLLTKVLQFESNTRYAQGGIAAVWDETKDNFDKHIADTLDAGDGLCNQEAVNNVVKEGPARVQEIIDWGTRFDKVKSDLAYDLGREGGHSENRILHYKDLSGAEMQRALMEKVKSLANITVKENYYAINLITQHHLGWSVTRVSPGIECYGAYVLNKATKEIETWVSKVTILATGGAGQIYRNTTNPQIATGDGVAMVYRAKGRVENMEFVQFHPTALYNPAGENPDFLVSEAVRGFGGILKTKDGE